MANKPLPEIEVSKLDSEYRFAAGLCPDPRGSLSAPPDPVAAVAVIVECIIPSYFLVAGRDAAQ